MVQSNSNTPRKKKDSPENSTYIYNKELDRDSALEYQYQHRVTAGGKETEDYVSKQHRCHKALTSVIGGLGFVAMVDRARQTMVVHESGFDRHVHA